MSQREINTRCKKEKLDQDKYMRFLRMAAFGLFLSVGWSQAAITIYSDRNAWRSAAGGSQVFFVDFNTYTTDVAATGPLDVGPFTLVPNLSQSWDMPLIETLSGGYGNALVANSPGVTMRLYGVGYGVQGLTVNFDNPITSFGFDIADSFGGGRQARITTSNGDFHDFVAHNGNTRFIGFTSTDSFSSIYFSDIANVRPVIDNFEANSAVPEPSAASLLGLGLAGLAALRRRK